MSTLALLSFPASHGMEANDSMQGEGVSVHQDAVSNLAADKPSLCVIEDEPRDTRFQSKDTLTSTSASTSPMRRGSPAACFIRLQFPEEAVCRPLSPPSLPMPEQEPIIIAGAGLSRLFPALHLAKI